MNLTTAIASGKRFARSQDASIGDYVTTEEFLTNGMGIDDFNATDYEVEPDVVTTPVSLNKLTAAWNDAKGNSTSIAIAQESKFFARMVQRLEASGVSINRGG